MKFFSKIVIISVCTCTVRMRYTKNFCACVALLFNKYHTLLYSIIKEFKIRKILFLGHVFERIL